MSIQEGYEVFLKGGGSERFLESCLRYDFKNLDQDMSELRIMYERSSPSWGKNLTLRSNGSSGSNEPYGFGPDINVVTKVESRMRGMKGLEGLIRINSSYPNYDTTRFSMIDWHDGSRLLKLDFTSKKCEEFFRNHVESNAKIETQPHVCRMILCQKGIVELMAERNIVIFSTCDDLSIPRHSLPVRDRMIDWKTGANFFECEFGSKHILPIWFEENGKSFNLLNPLNKQGHEVSDKLEVMGFGTCPCGKTAASMRFVSHFRFKPNSKEGEIDSEAISRIASLIPEGVFHIQFIESQGEINSLVDCDFDLDPSPFADFFGKKVTMVRDKVFRIGGYKMPFVWKSDSLNLTSSKNPII